MEDSPIPQLLSAIDRLDVDATVSLCTENCRLLSVDGQRPEGIDQIREFLSRFFAGLRSTSHKVVSEWHQGDTWIAEMDAAYELRNWLRIAGVPRALFVRGTDDGIVEARFYGAHERSIIEDGGGPEMARFGSRWIPPL